MKFKFKITKDFIECIKQLKGAKEGDLVEIELTPDDKKTSKPKEGEHPPKPPSTP